MHLSDSNFENLPRTWAWSEKTESKSIKIRLLPIFPGSSIPPTSLPSTSPIREYHLSSSAAFDLDQHDTYLYTDQQVLQHALRCQICSHIGRHRPAHRTRHPPSSNHLHNLGRLQNNLSTRAPRPLPTRRLLRLRSQRKYVFPSFSSSSPP